VHPRAFREALALEGQHLVVAGQPRGGDELGPRACLFVLDVARVGDLPAALGVEGRLLELGLEPPVAEILVREDRGQDVGLREADELAAGLTCQPHLRLAGRDRLARPRSLLLHQLAEAVFVDRQSALPRQLLR
jgi:hypothetical protein